MSGPNLLLNVWRMGFEASPVILTGGIASAVNGGLLPIITLTELGGASTIFNLINGQIPDIDSLFAHWDLIGGSMLMNNSIGKYPFANQVIAANAVIREALTVSLVMHCPAKQTGSMLTKLPTLTALKLALDYHIQNGGTFTVMTPAYIYTGCLLTAITDISQGESAQRQYSFKFDFEQPLIAEPTGNEMGNLMSKITKGIPINQELTLPSIWGDVKTAVSPALSDITKLLGI